MSYNFEKSVPVTMTGVGAKKMDNPFTDAVKSIAWKNDEATGKPLALSFVEEHDGGEESVTLINRIKRMLQEAGAALETPGTVRRHVETVKDGKGKVTGSRITFWVVKLQERPRKS